MIKIRIKQVLCFISNLFWSDEYIDTKFPIPLYKNKFDWTISLYKYKNITIKNCIWKLKFRADKNLARLFGIKIAETIRKYYLEDYILIPIPIHWRRRFERGFNQTEWLCKETFSAYQKNYWIRLNYKNILKRNYYSEKQSWNKKSERLKNVSRAFKLKIKYKNYISGNKCLLIDDVITTGSTLKEARHELLTHGASCVKAITLAY